MNRVPAYFLMVFCIVLFSLTPGCSLSKVTKGYSAATMAIPQLTLPDGTIATFADVPAMKEPSVQPRLRDSATTLDKAVNYKEIMKFLGISLTMCAEAISPEKQVLVDSSECHQSSKLATEQPVLLRLG